MHGADRVGRDATNILTREQWQFTREDVVGVVREKVIARNMIPFTKLANWGKHQFRYYTDVDMSPARVEMSGASPNADIAGISPATLDIPTIHKDFVILARELAASQNWGESLDTRSARMAAEKVAEKEEEMMWAGITVGSNHATAVTGLIGGAQSGGTGSDWGNATIATAVSNCKNNLLTTIHALRTDKFYGPYYLTLTKGAEVALWQTVPDTGGALLREFAEKLFTLGVFGTDALFPAVAASTNKSLAGEPGPSNHGYVIAQDVDTVVIDDSWDYEAKVFEALAPIVYRGNSLASITSIDEID